jgi:hypothetical protein
LLSSSPVSLSSQMLNGNRHQNEISTRTEGSPSHQT